MDAMAMADSPNLSTPSSPGRGAGAFATTRWTMVLDAAKADAPPWREAMGELFQSYWKPLYAFLRQRGARAQEAQDQVQAFFAHLIEKESLRHAERSRGRFRTFLLACMKNFLTNEHDKEHALKRGGGQRGLSLDFTDAERTLRLEPATRMTPEREFDHQWALGVVHEATARLRAALENEGKPEHAQCLIPLLSKPGERGLLAEPARRLSLTEDATRVALHRLRQRYRQVLRDLVAQTVADPAEVDGEIADLLAALSR